MSENPFSGFNSGSISKATAGANPPPLTSGAFKKLNQKLNQEDELLSKFVDALKQQQAKQAEREKLRMDEQQFAVVKQHEAEREQAAFKEVQGGYEDGVWTYRIAAHNIQKDENGKNIIIIDAKDIPQDEKGARVVLTSPIHQDTVIHIRNAEGKNFEVISANPSITLPKNIMLNGVKMNTENAKETLQKEAAECAKALADKNMNVENVKEASTVNTSLPARGKGTYLEK